MAQNKTKANVLRGERAESILDRDGATSTPPFFDGVILSRAGEHVFVDAELGRSHLIRERPHENGSLDSSFNLLCGGFGRFNLSGVFSQELLRRQPKLLHLLRD